MILNPAETSVATQMLKIKHIIIFLNEGFNKLIKFHNYNDFYKGGILIC